MKTKRSKCAFTLLFLMFGLMGSNAWAILGLGDIVFDPTNYARALEQLLELQRQYKQLTETYEVVRGQYDHMLRMARRVPVDMASRYRARVTPWQRSTATDTHGATSAWMNAINTGIDVAGGYAKAGVGLETYGRAFTEIPSEHLGRVKASYATVELTDGTNRHAMETIGRLRASAAQVENAIQALEDDSLSSSPDMNTEIAVLNKISAANVLSLRASQDANKLLVALAESQLVSAKRMRDAEAAELNNHIQFVKEGRDAIRKLGAGMSEAMRTWRLPDAR